MRDENKRPARPPWSGGGCSASSSPGIYSKFNSPMAASTTLGYNSGRSLTMERTAKWVVSQDIPTDILVKVGEASFSLHKFMLVAKSGLIRKKIMLSSKSDLTQLDLSDVPGGADTFERAAKFCYGVNFEITVHNVAALRCAAEYLEMTDKYCDGNLGRRTEEFLNRAALNSLPSSLAVLRSCERLLPMSDQLNIVQRCLDAVSTKACVESKFPTRSPNEWWAYELATLGPSFLRKTLAAMKSRGAASKALAAAVSAYAEKLLPGIVSGQAPPPPGPDGDAARKLQSGLLETLVSILPPDVPSHVSFLCCLLRAAIFLEAPAGCKKELERRLSAVLDQATAGDLLSVALDCGGERVADVDSVRRVVAGFVEKEGRGGTLYGGGNVCCSAAMQKVARTVDGFVGEIATDEALSVSKFAGVAGVVPKPARRFDDDLYRAVDIYLKAHPGLDEIEREKVCSVMDPMKLSYEARLHASQNKRLPLQIVLHALYYDQLQLRGGGAPVAGTTPGADPAGDLRKQILADSELVKENESLRSELLKMKMYVTDLQKGQGSSAKAPRKPTFFSSVSKTLGKFNPFRQGSKDTSSINDGVDVAKPKKRRFSVS